MEYLRSDCILKEILEDRKSLTGFLDAIFGFLSRNTDFYHIQTTKDDKLGFPRGIKEQILISCMQKYEPMLKQSELTKHKAVDPSQFVSEEIVVETEERSTVTQFHQGLEKANINSHVAIIGTANNSDSSAISPKFSESEYKNGAVFDNYCWSQTVKDVELCILLPTEVKLAKHLHIDFKSNYITVKTLHPSEQILINAETWNKYRYNDVVWSISDKKLLINLDKIVECWWDKLFLNEVPINIKNLNSERPINEYSPDVKKAIEKLHVQKFQQEQKEALQLNESEQITRLRQAWNSEGSPFKMQPFDDSIIQFN